MKKTVSLKENYLFRRTYQKGKSAADSRLVLYVRPNGRKGNRLGITVSTKLGCAVVRNRVRRRIREIYRLREDRIQAGTDIVVVARSRAPESQYQQLEKSFEHLADKLGVLRREDAAKPGKPAAGPEKPEPPAGSAAPAVSAESAGSAAPEDKGEAAPE